MMRIEVESKTDVITQTGKNGKPYKVFELTYISKNKKLNRKILSFSDVFKPLLEASAGAVFEVETTANGAYTDWNSVKVVELTPEVVADIGKAKPAAKSTYETPEERAHKQELICRQNAVSNAIALLSNEDTVTVEDVLKVAQKFRDWYFQVPEVTPQNISTPQVE